MWLNSHNWIRQLYQNLQKSSRQYLQTTLLALTPHPQVLLWPSITPHPFLHFHQSDPLTAFRWWRSPHCQAPPLVQRGDTTLNSNFLWKAQDSATVGCLGPVACLHVCTFHKSGKRKIWIWYITPKMTLCDYVTSLISLYTLEQNENFTQNTVISVVCFSSNGMDDMVVYYIHNWLICQISRLTHRFVTFDPFKRLW